MVTSSQIQQAYISDLSSNLPKLERKANDAIKSFAEFVTELNKVNKLSNGTPVKEQITKLTGELNNSSVFFARMIADELDKIQKVVAPVTETEEQIKL